MFNLNETVVTQEINCVTICEINLNFICIHIVECTRFMNFVGSYQLFGRSI